MGGMTLTRCSCATPLYGLARLCQPWLSSRAGVQKGDAAACQRGARQEEAALPACMAGAAGRGAVLMCAGCCAQNKWADRSRPLVVHACSSTTYPYSHFNIYAQSVYPFYQQHPCKLRFTLGSYVRCVDPVSACATGCWIVLKTALCATYHIVLFTGMHEQHAG